MGAKFIEFMLGVTVIVAQSALFGMLAWWLAGRASRLARVCGGVFIILMAWISFVPLLDRGMGYQPRSDVDSNLATIVALLIGWVAGRNRRLRVDNAVHEDGTGGSGTARLLFDRNVRRAGAVITGASQLYGLVVGLLGFFIELGIVSDVAGFWGLVVGFSAAPVTFAVAPLYAGFRLHNWMPAVFCYGGMAAMYFGYAFGHLVSEESL